MVDELTPIPHTGQRYYAEFIITLSDDTTYTVPINTLDYSKDITGPTGDGSLSMPNLHDIYKKLYYGQEFLIKGEWGTPDTKPVLKEIFKGTIEEVVRTGLTLDINFKDKGKLLEEEATVSFTQEKRSNIIKQIIEKAGLKAHIDFGDQPDDVIDYSSASGSGADEGECDPQLASTGRGGIYPKAYMLNACGEQVGIKYDHDTRKHEWGPWVNWCPHCKATGTLYFDEREGGIACKKCDVDASAVHGYGTTTYIGGREYGNAVGGTPACKTRLKTCTKTVFPK